MKIEAGRCRSSSFGTYQDSVILSFERKNKVQILNLQLYLREQENIRDTGAAACRHSQGKVVQNVTVTLLI